MHRDTFIMKLNPQSWIDGIQKGLYFLYLGIAGSKAMLPAIYLPPVVHFKGVFK